MQYFNEKGDFSRINVFDRDGFILPDVQKELNNVHINSYPARSDLVKCFYSIKIWPSMTSSSHYAIFSKI